MAYNTSGLDDAFGRMFSDYMATAGNKLADEFTKRLESNGKAKSGSASDGLLKQLVAAGITGTIAGAAASTAGSTIGAPAGQAVGAAGAIVTGAVGAATADRPAGVAAAALAGVATAGKLATDAMKGFAAAASPNGLKFLEQAIDVFSAAVGTKFLPLFVKLAAGVATAGDILWDEFRPKLNQTVSWFQEQTPVFIAFGKALAAITEWILGAIGKLAGAIAGTKLDIGGGAGKAAAAIADIQKSKPGESTAPPPTEPKAAEPGSAADIESKFQKNEQSILKGMAAAMGGKGGVGGVEDAWKKAQGAAFMDPMQAKQMAIQNQMLKEMMQVNKNTSKGAVAASETARKPVPVKR